MAPPSSTKQRENPSTMRKKRSILSLFPRKKSSREVKNEPLKHEPLKKAEENPSQNPRQNRSRENAITTELLDIKKMNDRDYSSSKFVSNRNLIAMAYNSTTSKSFRASPESAIHRFTNSQREIETTISTESGGKDESDRTGIKSSAILTRSSFFQKTCDDVFDSIDVNRSGKIDESELYQGLLLLHLKLGLYFGPAACKPISLDRTKFIFGKFDTNKDGSLDKSEFRSVLALLMGNVMTRIAFQFLCTLIIVPILASTLLEKILDSYEYAHDIVAEFWSSLFREYRPLIEVAFGWDLIMRFFLSPLTAVVRESWIWKLSFELLEVPINVVSETFDSFILQRIGEIPQETWDSLPLTFLSTILSLIIVPYSITKTDDFYRYLAKYLGGKKTLKVS